MSKWRETFTYGNCENKIDGVKKDNCQHFLASGDDGTPEALFCRGCGCHICFHSKHVHREVDKSIAIATYELCVKNHAVGMDERESLDGCREFLPAGNEGTPEALSCAACGCHRSFHAKHYL